LTIIATNVVDPDSVNPNPELQVNPDPDPGFDDPKLKKKNTADFLYLDPKLQFTYP